MRIVVFGGQHWVNIAAHTILRAVTPGQFQEIFLVEGLADESKSCYPSKS
jgi:hypothetical protein